MNLLVFILSAGVKKNKEGVWVSTDFTKKDSCAGAPGGKLRIYATYYLYKKNNNIKIICSGGRGHDIKNDEKERPNLSAIMKQELICLGVPENNILEENKTNKTYEQLIELSKFLEKETSCKAVIVTNEYHKNRVIEFMSNKKSPAYTDRRIEVLSAEKICLDNNSKKWKEIIKKAYESDYMKRIIKKEKNGVEQIKEGTYNY